jgi:hypothetical protein
MLAILQQLFLLRRLPHYRGGRHQVRLRGWTGFRRAPGGMGRAPVAPATPCSPRGPMAPAALVAPARPCNPCGPVAPATPSGPCGAVGPSVRDMLRIEFIALVIPVTNAQDVAITPSIAPPVKFKYCPTLKAPQILNY